MRKSECEDDMPQLHISCNSEEGDGVPQALEASQASREHWFCLMNMGSASGKRPDPRAVRAAVHCHSTLL